MRPLVRSLARNHLAHARISKPAYQHCNGIGQVVANHGLRYATSDSASGVSPAAIESKIETGSADEAEYAVQIKNPTALLNAIASTYKSMPRVIMEYVDNALDSAEDGKQTKAFQPNHLIDVRIDIDSAKKRIWIRDNSMGMNKDNLMQLVLGIGDSQKRNVEYLNGQFGFGAHAFRAAAESLRVYTSPVQEEGAKVRSVVLDRRSSQVPRPDEIPMDALLASDEIVRDAFDRYVLSRSEEADSDLAPMSILPNSSNHGTVVAMLDIDPIWFESVRFISLCRDIENHFEGLLSDNAARIIVGKVTPGNKKRKPTRREHTCKAFDYDSIKGTRFERTITAPDGSTVDVKVIVTQEVHSDKRVRFFKGGRAISDAFRLSSFLEESKYKGRLWEHPSVCGRIEVRKALTPVLTRDDFVRSANRKFIYKELRELEDELMKELQKVIDMTVEDTLSDLEDTLRDSMASLLEQDEQGLDPLEDDDTEFSESRELPIDDNKDDATAADIKNNEPISVDNVDYEPVVRKTPEERQQRKKKQKDGLFQIQFVRARSDDPDVVPKRSFVTDRNLYVNIDHADFQARLEKDREGEYRVGPRVVSYLCNEMATHHRLTFDHMHKIDMTASQEDSYESLVDSINKLEIKLYSSWSNNPASKRKVPKEIYAPPSK